MKDANLHYGEGIIRPQTIKAEEVGIRPLITKTTQLLFYNFGR
jgi:hypothetical protein